MKAHYISHKEIWTLIHCVTYSYNQKESYSQHWSKMTQVNHADPPSWVAPSRCFLISIIQYSKATITLLIPDTLSEPVNRLRTQPHIPLCPSSSQAIIVKLSYSGTLTWCLNEENQKVTWDSSRISHLIPVSIRPQVWSSWPLYHNRFISDTVSPLASPARISIQSFSTESHLVIFPFSSSEIIISSTELAIAPPETPL